jgi:hypothetical protein
MKRLATPDTGRIGGVRKIDFNPLLLYHIYYTFFVRGCNKCEDSSW